MKIGTLALSAIAGVAGLVATAGAASAYIACNGSGDCWHVTERYEYKPTFGVVVHDDNWRWREAERERYRWREHEGRGYWGRGGVWVTF